MKTNWTNTDVSGHNATRKRERFMILMGNSSKISKRNKILKTNSIDTDLSGHNATRK